MCSLSLFQEIVFQNIPMVENLKNINKKKFNMIQNSDFP